MLFCWNREGFKQCGGMFVARTNDRLVAAKRMLDKARAFGLECELISLEEAKRKWPFMRTDDLKGVLWLPEEGVTTPTDVCQALAKAAIKNGVRMYEKVMLESVQTSGRAVQGVITNKGDIRCDVFVNCGGQWAREIGQKSEPAVSVPLYSSEHFYIVTKPINGVDVMLPILRDPDGYVYLREWSGGINAGGFEPICKPCFHDGVPRDFEFQLLPEDWQHFEVLLEQIVHRVPVMANAEIRQMINGPESFTPDTRFILGEAPEIRNYFVAAGMNSSGIAAAGGVGKAIAEWIKEGEPTMDLWAVDIRRFGAGQTSKRYLRDRIKESPGWMYKLPYPCTERNTGRNLKCSPLYPQLEAAGASFGEKLGWERANWFVLPNEDRTNHLSFGKRKWFDNVEREYKACHNSLGISDMTSLGIFELQSKNAVAAKDFLQLLCVSNVDIPVGHTLNTAMLNARGGYQTECTLLRTEDNEYIIIVPTEFSTLAHSWINFHLPQHDFVTLRSLQSSFTVLGVFGPRSQEFLQGLTPTPLDTRNYPPGSWKNIHLAFASGVKMIRGTKTGHPEMSWLILAPTEHSMSLYDALMEAGNTFDIRNVGSYALECLRIEMGIPLSGYELTSHVTPYEAGLESMIDYTKSFKFIGMPILEHLKDKPVTKRLVYSTVEKHSNENLPWGGEPIVYKNDIIGTVTSVSYSFKRDKAVCLGYLQSNGEQIDSFFLENKLFFLQIAGQRYPLDVSLQHV